MKKIIKLTESDLSRIVKEAVSEISYKTMIDASNSANDIDIGDFVNPELESYTASIGHKINNGEVADAINTIKDALKVYGEKNSRNTYNFKDHTFLAPEGSKGQYQAAVNAIKVIEQFFIRKLKQQQNINSKAEDVTDSANDEFNNAVKTKYPEAYNGDLSWPVDFSKLSSDQYDDVVSGLSPRAKEVERYNGF